jgi:hypothetical protein
MACPAVPLNASPSSETPAQGRVRILTDIEEPSERRPAAPRCGLYDRSRGHSMPWRRSSDGRRPPNMSTGDSDGAPITFRSRTRGSSSTSAARRRQTSHRSRPASSRIQEFTEW